MSELISGDIDVLAVPRYQQFLHQPTGLDQSMCCISFRDKSDVLREIKL
jgi:hypothetical protein